MDVLTIEIKSISDYSKLFNICSLEEFKIKQINIIIRLNFINPHDVLLLVQSCIYIKQKFISVTSVKFSASETQIKYLGEIGLIEFLNKNYRQPRTIKFIDKQTAMPIRRVELESIEEYVIETLRYIGRICKGKELTVLSVGIKESINNVYDHAESEIGAYVFCQYYPKINSIKVCVSDIGIGIPTSVRKKIPTLTDSECIDWALKDKNTVGSNPRNAGLGLATIKSFTKNTNGELTIFSGKNKYYLNSQGYERFITNPIIDFKGTLIEVKINVDKLDDEEYIDDYFS